MTATYQLNLILELDAEPDLQSKSNDDLRSGCLCPYCGEGLLDYNGLIELECPVCGFTLGGGGCT